MTSPLLVFIEDVVFAVEALSSEEFKVVPTLAQDEIARAKAVIETIFILSSPVSY